MFEDLSAAPPHDLPPHEAPPGPDGLVVSGHADGGVVIRSRGAKVEPGCVVVTPEQAEGLIAAIRRYLNK